MFKDSLGNIVTSYIKKRKTKKEKEKIQMKISYLEETLLSFISRGKALLKIMLFGILQFDMRREDGVTKKAQTGCSSSRCQAGMFCCCGSLADQGMI
jgi:hypothetical protein